MSLADASATELSRTIASGDVSPVDVVEACLQRIECQDPALNAFVSVDRESALRAAAEAAAEIGAGKRRGSLHGVPIALKDLFDVAGQPTAAGSKILAAVPASEDAHVVACLRRAGAILIGRLAMHEFAYGITNDNPHRGPTRNPWNLDRVPGGSSGGSGAALAARLVPLSVGTDTGGSIRIPAAACGIAGLKPTRGRVSVRGVVPLSWSLDHVGPMARTVEDLALLLETIAAPDPLDRACTDRPAGGWSRALDGGLEGVRLGVPRRTFFAHLEADVESAVDQALATLASLGAVAVDLDLPHMEHAYTAFHTMLAAEAAAFHGPWLRSRPGDYGEDVRRALELGNLISAVDFVNARRMQAVVGEGFREALGAVDLLVTPTVPRTAPPIGEPMSREPHLAWGRLVAPFNLAGMPALSIPCGFDAAGLPIGLQLAGRWHDEAAVLRAGHAFQRVTDWHRRLPPTPRPAAS